MTTTVFERQSIRQRGHLSNYFCLNPVKVLAFDGESMRIATRFTEARLPYKQLRAEIRSTHIFKSYGTYAGAYMKQTLVSLKAPGRTYRFDLSGNFPDFAERGRILELIEEKIPFVEKTAESLSQVKRRQLIAPAIVIAAILLGLALFATNGI